jgi:hypothetical protein
MGVDILKFIFIAFIVYKFFSKKDKPPQRRPVSAEEYRQRARQTSPPREETLPAQVRREAPQKEKENAVKNIEPRVSEEGYSDYDQYVSAQGTQGVEGTSGYEGSSGYGGSLGEGSSGTEGSWGAEGSYYAKKEQKLSPEMVKSEVQPDLRRIGPILYRRRLICQTDRTRRYLG